MPIQYPFSVSQCFVAHMVVARTICNAWLPERFSATPIPNEVDPLLGVGGGYFVFNTPSPERHFLRKTKIFQNLRGCFWQKCFRLLRSRKMSTRPKFLPPPRGGGYDSRANDEIAGSSLACDILFFLFLLFLLTSKCGWVSISIKRVHPLR